jgi:stage II sporulation protein D
MDRVRRWLGHGVGISQTGAVGMAERGRTYQEILDHYYTGVELVTWY